MASEADSMVHVDTVQLWGLARILNKLISFWRDGVIISTATFMKFVMDIKVHYRNYTQCVV